MNILRRILNKIFGIPDAPAERPNEPVKLDATFPRPVTIALKSTQQVMTPMQQAQERAKRDAKKTAVSGRVSSASSSSSRPIDPLLDPLNPISPLSPLNPLNADDGSRIVGHRHHHQDATRISDDVCRSVPSHSEPVRHHDSGYSSHHDSSPSYDHSPSHDHGSSFDCSPSHHDSNW